MMDVITCEEIVKFFRIEVGSIIRHDALWQANIFEGRSLIVQRLWKEMM